MDRRCRIRAPRIITSRARRRSTAAMAHAGPAAAPFPLVVSHPVPPLPAGPGAVRAAAGPEMSLTADRTNYLVAEREFPTYGVTGAAPNQPILWSLWLDGVNVVEDQPFDTETDGQGNWFGRGSLWNAGHVGFWEILAKTTERQASVRLLVSADFGQVQPTRAHEMLGVTHVAGLYRFAVPDSDLEPESFLVEGAKHVRNLGARHLFVHLSPQYRRDYSFDDFGEAPYRSLTELAGSPLYRELFSLAFETFVLTSYTFVNWQWIQSRGQVGAVRFDPDGEREELAELVCHLAATYPAKSFIVKNWEGDWQMKLSYDTDSVASEQQVAEFVEWMHARQDGITLGRSRCTAQRVKHAIEFNLIHQAQRGLRSMLASVMPSVDSDLIAYASWWSLGRAGGLTRNLRDDIAFIRTLPGIGNRPLIVTEFGLSYLAADLQQRTAEAVEALSLAQVPMAFYWQIFDNGPDLALVGRDATRFESWHTIRSFIQVQNDAVFVPDETILPQRIVAGQQYPVRIAVRNQGILFDPVIGYALGLLDAQGRLLQVVWVRREVPAGSVATLEFTLNAPPVAGVYSLRMFQHGVELFGEEMPVEVHADAADGEAN